MVCIYFCIRVMGTCTHFMLLQIKAIILQVWQDRSDLSLGFLSWLAFAIDGVPLCIWSCLCGFSDNVISSHFPTTSDGSRVLWMKKVALSSIHCTPVYVNNTIYLGPEVYVYICVRVWEYICMCSYACGGQWSTLGVVPRVYCSQCLLGKGLSLPRTHQVDWAGWPDHPRYAPVSTSPVLRF